MLEGNHERIGFYLLLRYVRSEQQCTAWQGSWAELGDPRERFCLLVWCWESTQHGGAQALLGTPKGEYNAPKA